MPNYGPTSNSFPLYYRLISNSSCRRKKWVSNSHAFIMLITPQTSTVNSHFVFPTRAWLTGKVWNRERHLLYSLAMFADSHSSQDSRCAAMANNASVKQRVCLIVIDGWGISDEKHGAANIAFCSFFLGDS